MDIRALALLEMQQSEPVTLHERHVLGAHASTRSRRFTTPAATSRVRELLHQAVVRAAKAGARQVDIAQVIGYRRERVRQVLRAAGIEPAS